MRFYWGLGVGHVYSHQEGADIGEDMDVDEGELGSEDETVDGDKVLEEDEDENDDDNEFVEGGLELGNTELGLNDLEDDPWYDSDDSDDEGLEDKADINDEETG